MFRPVLSTTPASAGSVPRSPQSSRVAGSLVLGTAALILGLLTALPWLAHARAGGWPIVSGEVLSRTVLTRRGNGKGSSSIVRDTYRVPGANGPTVCYWDDPLGTGITRWINARIQTRDRYWPVGSQTPVRAEPYGDRCEPLGGFERAVRPTVAVVALATLACLCGLAFLWRPRPPAG